MTQKPVEEDLGTPRPKASDVAGQTFPDEGLRLFFMHTFNRMALAIGYTAVVALLTAIDETLLDFMSGGGAWLVFAAVLALGFFAERIVTRGSWAAVTIAFWGYATLWGLLTGPILAVYSSVDYLVVAQAFFATIAVFSAAALYGLATGRNLNAVASFFVIALVGLLAALIANFFIGSSLLSLLLSAAVVLVVSGLVAWETQRIRSWYQASDPSETSRRKAVFGAFLLYGSFVTIFIHILNILGLLRSE